jgi:hypothetical protein
MLAEREDAQYPTIHIVLLWLMQPNPTIFFFVFLKNKKNKKKSDNFCLNRKYTYW